MLRKEAWQTGTLFFFFLQNRELDGNIPLPSLLFILDLRSPPFARRRIHMRKNYGVLCHFVIGRIQLSLDVGQVCWGQCYSSAWRILMAASYAGDGALPTITAFLCHRTSRTNGKTSLFSAVSCHKDRFVHFVEIHDHQNPNRIAKEYIFKSTLLLI